MRPPAFRRHKPTKKDNRAQAAQIVAYRRANKLAPLPIETLCHSYGLTQAEAEAMNAGVTNG